MNIRQSMLHFQWQRLFFVSCSVFLFQLVSVPVYSLNFAADNFPIFRDKTTERHEPDQRYLHIGDPRQHWAFMVTIGNVQQQTATFSVLSSRALYAAESGIQ